MLVDSLGDRRRQPCQLLQLGEAGPLHGADAAELVGQALAPGRPEARNAVERTFGHAALAQLAVERDGETVRLVPRLLQQVDGLTVTRYHDRLGAAGDEDLFELLGERGDGDLVGQAQLLEDLHADAELALPSVEEQQLRWVGEAGGAPTSSPERFELDVGGGGCPGPRLDPIGAGRARRFGDDGRLGDVRLIGRVRLEQVAQAPGEHFVHGAVVVVPLHGAHLEAAVVGALRQAVLEHDHRADVVGPLQVAHVVARRSRWRFSCSAAFWRAVSRSSRLRPRSGTRRCTLPPRRRPSHSA